MAEYLAVLCEPEAQWSTFHRGPLAQRLIEEGQIRLKYLGKGVAILSDPPEEYIQKLIEAGAFLFLRKDHAWVSIIESTKTDAISKEVDIKIEFLSAVLEQERAKRGLPVVSFKKLKTEILLEEYRDIASRIKRVLG